MRRCILLRRNSQFWPNSRATLAAFFLVLNGGYFVLSPSVGDLIAGDEISWEQEPLEQLSAAGELGAYRHEGFWQAMDTLREKNALEALWQTGNAPWKTW